MEKRDQIDEMILELLKKDGRISYSDLGKQVGLTRVAAKNRVIALEETGAIQGYRAVVDPGMFSNMQQFVIIMETEPALYEEAVELLRQQPCVQTLCQISGGSKVFAVCAESDLEGMSDFLKTVRGLGEGVLRLQVHDIWSTVKGSMFS